MTATRLGRAYLEPALRQLPSMQADAYRLHASGVDELSIAIHLEIAIEDVRPLVEQAEEKVWRYLGWGGEG
jgi:hypothetical protein